MSDMNILHRMVKDKRRKEFEESEQASLGELIKAIETCGTHWGTPSEDKTVRFDFGSAIPTYLSSWRGSYDELALGYRLSGYDNSEEHHAQCTVDELLTELKSAIGKEYYGWKGGDFKMDENTPVWVDNSGNCSDTAIVGVIDRGFEVIIMTSWMEY